MGAKSEALAKQFEAKAQADWKKVTEAEKWTVGVTAHHVATALEPIAGMITAIVSGQARGSFTMGMLDEMSAKHAKEHASCTKGETSALLKKGTAAAAAVVRGLSDDQLARSGTVVTDAPPMTAEQVVTGGLFRHIDEHFGSIRKTVGK